jgi:hypothetical protein
LWSPLYYEENDDNYDDDDDDDYDDDHDDDNKDDHDDDNDEDEDNEYFLLQLMILLFHLNCQSFIERRNRTC